VQANLSAPQRSLLVWADAERRDLPWRRTRDPWAVLVSEFMLQQTQVARVIPRFTDFLERFPTAAACAEATLGDVLRLWAGLGYNRRATNLHGCAVAITGRHGGRVPDDLEALLRLPGVGPYTARAVLAFAFEADVGVVDTNAARVLARRAGRRMRPREAQDLADDLVPGGLSWSWNQAMMDLGAQVCRARDPRCTDCPLSSGCTWWTGGRVGDDPAVGSAGVTGPQSRFEGSDRQGRGRLVEALRHGPVDERDLVTVMGWPGEPERASRVAQTLVSDGLAVCDGARFELP
jgi:A/G-specific adenine glycosylase